MLEALLTRESNSMITNTLADHSSHIGFERLSLENIDAVLKGQPPLTPVNLHLMASKSGTSA